RAGLSPYLIVDDRQPGGRHWDRIETAIKGSHSTFIIWAQRTEWGEGVQREVELCRKHSVAEVLLLEQSLGVPELFRATAPQQEYIGFHREDPAEPFERAVVAVRKRLLLD